MLSRWAHRKGHARTDRATRPCVEAIEARVLFAVGMPTGYEEVDQIIVPSDGTEVQSNVTLESGVDYFVRASGSYTIATGAKPRPRLGDAASYEKATTYDWVADGKARLECGVSWGGHQDDFIYGGFVTGSGGPLPARIVDQPTSDNDGSLLLEIFKLVPRISVQATDANADEDGSKIPARTN